MEDNILKLHEISYCYPSGVLALDSICLDLPKGKKIAMLGANGAGKSTLMFLLNGILKPTEGYLSYKQKKYSYKRKDLRTLRTNIGFLFQDSDNQLIAPTVFEEVSFGLTNMSSNKDWVRTKVDVAIEDFCLQNIKDRTPHELSAGQKKRVCLASILAMEPEVVICDEPSSNLDSKHTQLTFNYLNNLNKKGKTILIATHDVNLAYEWADYIIILKQGKQLGNGTPKDIFGNTQLIKEAGLNLPFLVEASYKLYSNLNISDLPLNMLEFKNLINKHVCME